MPFRTIALTLLCFFCYVYGADARELNYKVDARYWGTEDGLSHREVNCIYQDRRGLIWIGTKIGLNRFDGKHFKVYTSTSANLTTDNIVRIIQDADGLLWLFSYKEYSLYGVDMPALNIDIFDPLQGTSIPFSKKFANLPVSKISFTTCIAGPEGKLILGAQKPAALVEYQSQGKFEVHVMSKYRDFYPALLASDKTVWGVVNHNQIIQLDTNANSLFQYNTGVDTVLHHDFTFEKDGYIIFDAHQNDRTQERYYRIKDGKVSVGRKEWLDQMHLNPAFNNYIFPPKKDLAIGFTYQVDDYSRPHFFNTKTGAEYYMPATFKYGGENEYRAYYVDREGALWLGTQFGLYRFVLKKDRFERFLYFENEKPFNTSMRGLLIDNDNLYANIERDGLMNIDTKTGDVKYVTGRNDAGKVSWSLALFNDRKGNMWSYNSDYIRKVSTDAADVKVDVSRRFIWSGYDDDTAIYLGSNFSLMYLEPNSEKVKLYPQINGFKELANTQVSFIQKDKAGVIWLCTGTGLYTLEGSKGITARYSKEGKSAQYLPASGFWHFHVDSEGYFWLATSGDGIIKWKPGSNQYKQYTKEDGLSDNNIYAIYEDKAGHLWMSSDFGIMQFNKKTEQVNVYLPKDGTSAYEYNSISHCQGDDGSLYFGSLNGITSFNPADFYQEGSFNEFPVIITSYSQFDDKGEKLIDKTRGLYSNNKIELYPGNYYFQLEFAVLDYDQNEKISYAWKLEGLDKDWHYQTENSLKIASIPYGSYILLLKARAGNGVWNKNEIKIPIRVYPPIYMRWWFILLLVVFFVVSIRLYLKWRTAQLRKREQDLQCEVEKQTATIRQQADDLKKIDEAKNRLFANVTHELRTPLTLITGPIESALKNKEQFTSDQYKLLDTARKNSKQLLQLVNEILELSKFDAGKAELNTQRVNFYALMDKMMSLFVNNAERLNISASFEYKISKDIVMMLDVPKFEKVVNNLLSNALKFTPPGGSINLSVAEDSSRIFVVVEDTGRGIYPEDMPYVFDRYYQTNRKNAAIEGGTGIGLALCKELVSLMDGIITVESEVGKGSIFTIQIPKTKAAIIDPELQKNIGLTMRDNTNTNFPGEAGLKKLQARTVLIVEDNESMRDYLHYILSSNYNILLAENGKVALEILHAISQQIEAGNDLLILSDLMMPVMDGMELLDNVKKHQLYYNIPFVLLTARPGIEDKLNALRIGVDDYMLKPFNEEELNARIGNLFNNSISRKVFITEEKKMDVVVGGGGDSLVAGEIDEDDIKAEPSESQVLWLKDIEGIIINKVGDSILTVEWLANTMTLSRRQLLRRVKALTGLTPQEYILEIRLTKARAILENQKHTTIKAVAIEVGFSDTSYFSTLFKKRFGKNPSEYLDYSNRY